LGTKPSNQSDRYKTHKQDQRYRRGIWWWAVWLEAEVQTTENHLKGMAALHLEAELRNQ